MSRQQNKHARLGAGLMATVTGGVGMFTSLQPAFAEALEATPQQEAQQNNAQLTADAGQVTLPGNSVTTTLGGETGVQFSNSQTNQFSEIREETTAATATNLGSQAAIAVEADASAGRFANEATVSQGRADELNLVERVETTPSTADEASEVSPASRFNASQVQILTPTVGSILDVPAATVILQYPSGATVQLRVNDSVVNTELIGRTETNAETGLVTETWYGVSLKSGVNQITVTAQGDSTPLTAVEVQVRGAPTELTVGTRQAEVAADGRSTVTVQGELLDENGNRSTWDAVVTLTASDGEFVSADYSPDTPGFQVQAQNGYFTAELKSSLEAHLVQLQAVSNTLIAFGQVQFVTQQRPTLVSGVVDLSFGARGTNFYSSYRDFLPADGDNRYELDLDAAVFATGSIGEWLFTGAYNSDRPLNEDCAGNVSLFRQDSNCDNKYPVYGDDSQRDVIAPSIDNLYLRLERTSPVLGAGSDYVMWGDYSTEEFSNASQLFTATNRQLHGFKFNYNLGDLALTGFYGNNIEGFQRDTIAPDGTSGNYFLSRRLIVPGSESIFIEFEELDRPGTVVERQQVFRGSDYEIDYDRGTVLFRDAILRTAVDDFGQVLVRRIVATYQYESQGESTNIIGGRIQYNLDRTLNQSSWIGASYLQENQGNREFELMGADAQISFGDTTRLIAEYAYSSSDFDLSGPISGSAYRVELDGSVSDWLQGRAYYRHTDPGFNNQATTSFTPGQTRYGAQINARIADDTALRLQFDQENNEGTAPRPLLTLADLLTPGSSPLPGSRVDNSLTTYSVGLSQRLGDSNLELDWIHRDRIDRAAIDRLTANSDQIRTRLSTNLGNNTTVYAQNELNLSSESDPLYPNRTLFGMNWQLMPGISLGVNQIFFGDGGLNYRDSITTVDLSGEYNLSADTTIHGRFSVIEGQQIGGAIGFDQGFTLAPGLRLDLAYEHIFNNLYGSTAAGATFAQPFAVGSGASALQLTNGDSFSIGLAYTDNPDYQANARLEHRTSSQGSNTVFTASALGRLTPAVSALFNYEWASAANQGLEGLNGSSTLKLGLAYRDPNDDRFNALLRYEHRINPSSLPTNLLFGSDINSEEHLLSAEAIYAPNWQWELYGKYAFRNSSTRIGGAVGDVVVDEFSSTNAVHLAQIRATYRFGYDWDLTAEARWIGSSGYSEFGGALELGYYMTPDLRLYTGYSFGGANDRDFTGSDRSASGLYVGITAKLNNLFDGFGSQPVIQPVSAVETATNE
ncbi:TonB-dependent receptor [Almyronema epifaneia]|uniref:TonB-dependent receptor n=1 Tax=Almyronema epifaneia S1 TaxID=2991925 RepID=A0ABW6IGW1_9CYAN